MIRKSFKLVIIRQAALALHVIELRGHAQSLAAVARTARTMRSRKSKEYYIHLNRQAFQGE